MLKLQATVDTINSNKHHNKDMVRHQFQLLLRQHHHRLHHQPVHQQYVEANFYQSSR